MRTTELGVVIVMVVVRARPNTTGAEDHKSKDPHQYLGQAGMRQDGTMLLIVVDDEKAKMEKPSKKAARYFAREMEVPEGAGEGSD
jgi:hypothetical protein